MQPKPGDWAERYEALRAHALGEGPLGFAALGLAVLRHRGVAAWMLAESRACEGAVARSDPGPTEDAAELPLLPARATLVAMLAGTALLVADGGRR